MLEAIALSLLIVTIIIVTLILIVIGTIQVVYNLIFNKKLSSPIIELLNNKVLAMTLIIGDIILIALWFN